jgi:hypothetical protein
LGHRFSLNFIKSDLTKLLFPLTKPPLITKFGLPSVVDDQVGSKLSDIPARAADGIDCDFGKLFIDAINELAAQKSWGKL